MRNMRFAIGASAFLLVFAGGALAQKPPATSVQQLSPLNVEVPRVVGRSMPLGHMDPNTVVPVTVSIAPGDPVGLQSYADSVSNPKSRNYRNFLTPEQVGERFGLPLSTLNSVASYLTSNGFKINLIAKNRLSILTSATLGNAEKAFGTTINRYQALSPYEAGNTSYYSYSTALSLPSSIAPAVIDVSGLENFTKPQPRTTLTPTMTRVLYNTAPMYNGGTQGQNRTVGISNFDGYRLSNVNLYYAQYGLPTPPGGVTSNITVVTISGGAGSGSPGGEGDLDIQQALGMAPLCNLRIYDTGSSDLIGCLTQEANDNAADVITESYGWNISASTATSAHDEHLSMSAEGITYMAASGDSGTSLEPYSYPDYEPEVLQVGGSAASTDGSGNRQSEVAWNSGGGGWSTNTASFNTLPSWQRATGCPTNINERLVPDVCLHASGDQAGTSGAYWFYYNGSLTNGYLGTSFASPAFAGSLAVSEQSIIAQGGLPPNGSGKQRFGRIQDLFYSQNMRSDVWYDITVGSNGTLPNGSTSNAGPGWDFCTGLGAINFNAFVATQVSATPPAAPTNLTATGGNAVVSLSWSASTGATSYNVLRSTTNGGPYSSIASTSSTSYSDTGVSNGTTYYYVVTASNSAGTSGDSNQASATPNVTIPPAPTNLTATAGNAQVSLSWSASSGATSYNVMRSTTNGGPYSLVNSTSSTSYTDTGLTNGTTYYYVVTASNTAGTSGNSNQASATPQSSDFTITVSPTSRSVRHGRSTSYTVTIGAVNGFSGSVSLSVSGLGSGATGSFNPTSVTGSGNSTMTIRTTFSAQRGTFTLTVKGTSGSLSHTKTVTLTVT